MKLSNGATIEDVTGSEGKELLRLFAGYKDGVVRVAPTRCLLPTAYKKHAEKYLNFKVRLQKYVNRLFNVL